MSQDQLSNDKIGKNLEPVDFQAPTKATENKNFQVNPRVRNTSGADVWWQSQFKLMLLVFALLGSAALLFIVLSPEPSSTTKNVRVEVSGESVSGESVPDVSRNTEAVSPFSQSQIDQARADSQDILAELLDIQKMLKNKQVDDWALQDYESALKEAELGDELYSQKDYPGAIAKYRSSLDSLEAIEQRLPEEVTRTVALGNGAIEEGKSDLANQYFESALQLDRNNIPALQGLDRVKTLDQVLSLIAIAADLELSFVNKDDLTDLQAAKTNLQAALDMDASTQSAIDGLARLDTLEQDKLYRDAMSAAYANLFARKYTSARSGFSTALKHKPDDQVATAGLRQALASDKRTSLSSLLTAARRFEAQEEWASALSNYQTVLQRDRNQVSAKVGQIRSQARLELDRNLKRVLSDPLILAKQTNKAEAQDILSQARAIKSKGPGLEAQVNELQTVLNNADVTIKVAFQSDLATEVSLKKEGAKRINLGRFKSKKMALKPGRYVLIGTRLGFRDVRKEVELRVGSTNEVLSFNIICQQALVASQQGGV